ncbi:hypothetical protein WN55_09264 [Dufourea novaeangliae]|uniref:Uncharacterized protein n=1 Tax=Dufourea novaeangliae TaxID=178035 RepID=A0A154PAZ3_DUFNO|nr:hypothetical protein WN55_09264 [Dufourea novaeangliae]
MDDEQQLFLIEFLVDRIKIPVIRAMQEELLPACTCVSFQILSLPAIDICQEALTDGCGCNDGDTQIFKKGKSCLFALPSIVLQKPLTTFPIKLTVYKKLPPGVLPDVMAIGSYEIEAKALMNAVLSQQVFKIPNPCQTIKDTFKISTATGQCVGTVTVYVRASGFGRKIITQFQIPHNRKPYLFKGVDDSPVFQCKKIPSTCYTPAPVKCTCTKKCLDGSGEFTGRTCCPTPSPPCPPSPPKIVQPDWGPRPCCPSRQASPGAPNSTCPPRSQRNDQQAASFGNCPPCCTPQHGQLVKLGGQPGLSRQQSVADGKCLPCSLPKPQNDGCAPCCGAPLPPSKGFQSYTDPSNKEASTKKCGCPVKDYSCNCRQK